MPDGLAERILRDCRGAVGEVRFGFGSKRQVWAFEDRHQLDAAALAEELAQSDPPSFLELAVTFHDEFAAVTNSWRVRDRIQGLMADLSRRADAELLARIADALVDDHLSLRHWLVAAFAAGPPATVFRAFEEAVGRAYLPRDLWALLPRLHLLAEAHGWTLRRDATAVVIALAQFSTRSEDRMRAIEMLASFGDPTAGPLLARAARGDADASVRAHAQAQIGRAPGTSALT